MKSRNPSQTWRSPSQIGHGNNLAPFADVISSQRSVAELRAHAAGCTRARPASRPGTHKPRVLRVADSITKPSTALVASAVGVVSRPRQEIAHRAPRASRGGGLAARPCSIVLFSSNADETGQHDQGNAAWSADVRRSCSSAKASWRSAILTKTSLISMVRAVLAAIRNA